VSRYSSAQMIHIAAVDVLGYHHTKFRNGWTLMICPSSSHWFSILDETNFHTKILYGTSQAAMLHCARITLVTFHCLKFVWYTTLAVFVVGFKLWGYRCGLVIGVIAYSRKLFRFDPPVANTTKINVIIVICDMMPESRNSKIRGDVLC
jgi:hypothetical protein